jgi:hypothetical protein
LQWFADGGAIRRRVKIDSNEKAELWGWNWRLGVETGEHSTSKEA